MTSSVVYAGYGSRLGPYKYLDSKQAYLLYTAVQCTRTRYESTYFETHQSASRYVTESVCSARRLRILHCNFSIIYKLIYMFVVVICENFGPH